MSSANPAGLGRFGRGSTSGEPEQAFACALLEHFERPTALLDAKGRLVAMNTPFQRQSELVGSSLEGLRLERGLLRDGTGRTLSMVPLVSPLNPDNPITAGWQLLQLASRTVSLPAMAERFAQLEGQGAVLLQLELRKQGGLLNRLPVDRIETIVDRLEERLQNCLPEGSSVCRSRGERLIALIPGQRRLWELQEQAQAWQRSLSEPIVGEQGSLLPTLSLGLSRSPQDGQRFELLLDSSDQALARAHRQPTASACLAAPPERAQRQLRRLARPLAHAIDQQKLWLAYQPIVELASQRVEGVEVLCRWQDPILGRVSQIGRAHV